MEFPFSSTTRSWTGELEPAGTESNGVENSIATAFEGSMDSCTFANVCTPSLVPRTRTVFSVNSPELDPAVNTPSSLKLPTSGSSTSQLSSSSSNSLPNRSYPLAVNCTSSPVFKSSNDPSTSTRSKAPGLTVPLTIRSNVTPSTAAVTKTSDAPSAEMALFGV